MVSRAYKKAATPSAFPSPPIAWDAARLRESLAGAPQDSSQIRRFRRPQVTLPPIFGPHIFPMLWRISPT
jgi:hypothetical protein